MTLAYNLTVKEKTLKFLSFYIFHLDIYTLNKYLVSREIEFK